MKKKMYSICNLFQGTRIDIEAKDRKDAATIAYVLLFNQEKESNAKELTMANKEKAIELTGFDIESGDKLTVLVIDTDVVEKTDELKIFKKVN
jgi:hypothetical protein